MPVPARRDDDQTVLFEDCRILFRNFEGRVGPYNPNGDKRDFCVLIDPDVAEGMKAEGWNVKYLKPREEGDLPQPYMQVAVGFKIRPPRMVIITSRGRTDLTEDECQLIDWADIEKTDLIVRPYNWNVSGNTGRKAYLQSIFITIREDYLDQKYSHVEYAQLPAEMQPLAIEVGQGEFVDADWVIEEGEEGPS